MSESVVESLAPKTAESYNLLRTESGRFPVPDLAAVEITGEDRKGWLQGQATNNLRSLDFGASSSFCLCEPTGQILSVCDIWALKDRFVVVLPKAALDNFMKRVEQMVILEDVQARVMEHALISVQGPTATSRLATLAQLPTLDANEAEIEGADAILLRSNRAGQGGWDVLLPADSTKALKKLEKEFAEIDAGAAEIARIEAGVPIFGKDINPKTMPPELGQAFDARYVSYNKGCYTGQEVLMRIHSRGHTNKTWMGLLADGPLAPQSVVTTPRNPNVGEVTSATFSPTYGHIGAAILRNEVAFEGEIVTVETPNGPVEAEVREMPLFGDV